MPTEQELKEKEQEELSDIQFSAHITEEFTAEITEPAPDTAPEQPLPEDEFSQRDREILAALDEMLQKNSAPPRNSPEKDVRTSGG